jgi:hypothetical protein
MKHFYVPSPELCCASNRSRKHRFSDIYAEIVCESLCPLGRVRKRGKVADFEGCPRRYQNIFVSIVAPVVPLAMTRRGICALAARSASGNPRSDARGRAAHGGRRGAARLGARGARAGRERIGTRARRPYCRRHRPLGGAR